MRHLQLLGLCLGLSLGISCGGQESAPVESHEPEEAHEPQVTPPEAAPVDLSTCPREDGPWRNALRDRLRERDRELRRQKLGELAAQAETLTERCVDAWQPHWLLGEVRRRTGRAAEAAGPWQRALELARESGDQVGVAWSGYRLGWQAMREGRGEDGAARYQEALAAADAAGRHDLAAPVLNGLARSAMQSGDLAGAEGLLSRSESALRMAGMSGQARRLRINRASLNISLGDAAEARRILEQAYDESVVAEDGYVSSRAALALGTLFLRLRQANTALDWYARVEPDDDALAVLVHVGVGHAHLQQARWGEATTALDAAWERASQPVDHLLIDIYRAEAAVGLGELETAARLLDDVTRRADAADVASTRWRARWIAGRAARAAGDPAGAIDALRESVRLIEELGDGLDPLDNGLRYLRDRAEPYADLAATLAERPEPPVEEILRVAERTHARALRAQDAGSSDETLALAELQSRLPADTVILDYLIGEERGVVLAISRDGVEARRLVGWRVLRRPLRRYRAALWRPLRSAEARLDPMADLARSLEHGRVLTRELIEPVSSLLAGRRRLLIVPDRELATIPFAALPGEEGTYLGDRFETGLLPMTGLPRYSGTPRRVLLGGDPVASREGLGRLPRAADELQGLAKIWDSAEVRRLEREGLLRDALIEALGEEPGLVHLAAHANASTSDPRECAIFLSESERLGIDDLSDVRLPGSTVVLSACRTGEGEVVPGEGVIGLGWAFLRAGASGVAATLWKVDDGAAEALSTALHRRLAAGDDTVAALAAARREARARNPHPAFWAPYVLWLRPSAIVSAEM